MPQTVKSIVCASAPVILAAALQAQDATPAQTAAPASQPAAPQPPSTQAATHPAVLPQYPEQLMDISGRRR